MINQKLTNACALGTMSMPLWLPSLAELSQTCAKIAPILGVVWLLFQFWLKIRDERRKRRVDLSRARKTKSLSDP